MRTHLRWRQPRTGRSEGPGAEILAPFGLPKVGPAEKELKMKMTKEDSLQIKAKRKFKILNEPNQKHRN